MSLRPASEDGADEQGLVEAFKHGDGSAFDRLVAQHHDQVRRLVHRMSGWNGDTDDVVQDVFLAAFLGLKRFDGRSSLRTWLFAIAMNKCRRRRRWRWLHLARVEKAAEVAGSSTAGEDERFEEVRQAVRSLPNKYREVVVLRYLEGLETEAICEILKVSSNVVYVRLNRAREMLKTRLSELAEGL